MHRREAREREKREEERRKVNKNRGSFTPSLHWSVCVWLAA